VRHQRHALAAKQCHQVVDHPVLRRAAGNHGLENMGIVGLPCAAYGSLFFEAIDNGLHRRIRQSFMFGKRLQQFANGRRAFAPQRLHNAKFEFRQFGQRHIGFDLLRYAADQSTTRCCKSQGLFSRCGRLESLIEKEDVVSAGSWRRNCWRFFFGGMSTRAGGRCQAVETAHTRIRRAATSRPLTGTPQGERERMPPWRPLRR
jgi:hypothetical protein